MTISVDLIFEGWYHPISSKYEGAVTISDRFDSFEGWYQPIFRRYEGTVTISGRFDSFKGRGGIIPFLVVMRGL